MDITKQSLKQFRTDFSLKVKELESTYGVTISLGTITFDEREFRCKLTASKGGVIHKTLNSFLNATFRIGDKVKINHKKVRATDVYTVIKVNNKSLMLKREGSIGITKCSPSLCEKI